MMNRTLLVGLAATSMVSATATVTSMFIFDTDPQPLVASIDATATTYSINCAPGTDSSDCGMGPGLTLIAEPTTTTMILDSPDEDFYYTCVCSVDGTMRAVCTETASGADANFPGTSTTTVVGGLDPIPVTITAGSVTSVAASAAHTTTVPTASSTGSAATITGKQTETSAVSTGSATAGAANASKTTTASNVNASATGTGKASLAKSDAALVLGAAAAAAFVAAVL
ncbi:hypothetical protein AbraIFM66950_008625 [Aspergillus brasiliensis]|nr:hypothetical protein AbraIFM66950_008625 [Aspergillus brasiliensis]